MANYYDQKGMTLDMVWEMIGQRYGYHLDIVKNMPFFGPEGEQTMKSLMDTLHSNPFLTIGKYQVVKVEDYQVSKSFSKNKDGEIVEKGINLPKSNVVKLIFKDHSYICVRPSGTEPKVKFYIGVTSKNNVGLEEKINQLFDGLKEVLKLD